MLSSKFSLAVAPSSGGNYAGRPGINTSCINGNRSSEAGAEQPDTFLLNFGLLANPGNGTACVFYLLQADQMPFFSFTLTTTAHVEAKRYITQLRQQFRRPNHVASVLRTSKAEKPPEIPIPQCSTANNPFAKADVANRAPSSSPSSSSAFFAPETTAPKIYGRLQDCRLCLVTALKLRPSCLPTSPLTHGHPTPSESLNSHRCARAYVTIRRTSAAETSSPIDNSVHPLTISFPRYSCAHFRCSVFLLRLFFLESFFENSFSFFRNEGKHKGT